MIIEHHRAQFGQAHNSVGGSRGAQFGQALDSVGSRRARLNYPSHLA
jgi:hypothetical protein